MCIWTGWSKRGAGTKKFENQSTEKNSKVIMYTVCPEEGRIWYQNFRFTLFNMNARSKISPILAIEPAGICRP